MDIINISTSSIPKIIFGNKVYGGEFIPRVKERFYRMPIDNDDFDYKEEQRQGYHRIIKMKLWNKFPFNTFLIILKDNKDYLHVDNIFFLINMKNQNCMTVEYGPIINGKGDIYKKFEYTEKDIIDDNNNVLLFKSHELKDEILNDVVSIMSIFVECNNFFDKKEIVIGGRKNKKKKSLVSYIFNISKFESEYVGVNSYDSIIIKGKYNFFDPDEKIKNIFPLNKAIIKIPFEDFSVLVSFEKSDETNAVLRIYTLKAVDLTSKPKKVFPWGPIRVATINYNSISNTFDIVKIGREITTDVTIDDIEYYIDILFDVFKYMVYNKNINSNSGNTKLNKSAIKERKSENKYRNNTDICSIAYDIDSSKIVQVDESVIDEKHRQVKPCEYAFTVRGHYRHLKDGRLIWVNSYIKNKDKEFKPKNYIDNKKEG